MSGFLRRWMIASLLDDQPVSRDPRAWRASQEGGEYARELREISQRLREEAPMDIEWPQRSLRRRTLTAVRECYIRRQRRQQFGVWSFNASVSPRLITTLAACVVFSCTASLVIHQGGPELFDSVRNAFTQPQHMVITDPRNTSSSEMVGIFGDDSVLDPIAHDSENAANTRLGRNTLHDENEPTRADISEPDSSRSKPSDDLP